MSHSHNLIDDDKYFVIDPDTRVISNPDKAPTIVVKNDHNSECIRFKIKRFIEGHDMSQCDKIRVHSMNVHADDSKVFNENVVECDLVTADDENVTFRWLIGRGSTKYHGDLVFTVQFICFDGEKVIYAFNTLLCKLLKVGYGYSISDATLEDHYDILEQWYKNILSASIEYTNRTEYAAKRIETAMTSIPEDYSVLSGDVEGMIKYTKLLDATVAFAAANTRYFKLNLKQGQRIKGVVEDDTSAFSYNLYLREFGDTEMVQYIIRGGTGNGEGYVTLDRDYTYVGLYNRGSSSGTVRFQILLEEPDTLISECVATEAFDTLAPEIAFDDNLVLKSGRNDIEICVMKGDLVKVETDGFTIYDPTPGTGVYNLGQRSISLCKSYPSIPGEPTYHFGRYGESVDGLTYIGTTYGYTRATECYSSITVWAEERATIHVKVSIIRMHQLDDVYENKVLQGYRETKNSGHSTKAADIQPGDIVHVVCKPWSDGTYSPYEDVGYSISLVNTVPYDSSDPLNEFSKIEYVTGNPTLIGQHSQATRTGACDLWVRAKMPHAGINLWSNQTFKAAVSYTIYREGKPFRKKIMMFGDSITSDLSTLYGSIIADILDCDLIKNYAVGGATCCDKSQNGTNLTGTNVTEPPYGDDTYPNCLSTQVRRALKDTTTLGAQIKWTHPTDGEFSIPTNIATGSGFATAPDIIYIAIGINDGNSIYTNYVDDSDEAIEKQYSNLSKIGFCDALRWSIETLQCAYPNAAIFVATPLFTSMAGGAHHKYPALTTKRKMVMDVARYCSVPVIDSQAESGFTKAIAAVHTTLNTSGKPDGVHPDWMWRTKISEYVANEIKNRYVYR